MEDLGRHRPFGRFEPTEYELRELTGPQYKKHIVGEWRQSANHILACARWCARASKFLLAGDLEALKAQLPFDASTFSKLKSIGDDERLYDTRICPLLPPHMSVIYEFHLLGDEALVSAVKTGAVHPQVRRQDVAELRTKRPYTRRATLPDDVIGAQLSSAAKARPAREEMRVFCEIRVRSDASEEMLEELRIAIRELVVRHEAKFVERLTSEARAIQKHEADVLGFFARALKKGRKLARKRIGELKKRYAAQNKKWAFDREESTIGSDHGWEEIAWVFGCLGIEDEVDAVRQKAEAAAKMPDPPKDFPAPQLISKEDLKVVKLRKDTMPNTKGWK